MEAEVEWGECLVVRWVFILNSSEPSTFKGVNQKRIYNIGNYLACEGAFQQLGCLSSYNY
jgi:hypothetical protein